MTETFEFSKAKASALKVAQVRRQNRKAIGVICLTILILGVGFYWNSLSSAVQTGIVVAALIAVAVSIMMRDLSNNE